MSDSDVLDAINELRKRTEDHIEENFKAHGAIRRQIDSMRIEEAEVHNSIQEDLHGHGHRIDAVEGWAESQRRFFRWLLITAGTALIFLAAGVLQSGIESRRDEDVRRALAEILEQLEPED
jgi:hypothetical protein